MSRRLAGRFELAELRREFDRKNGKLIGNYDASVRGLDPYPDSDFHLSGDPSSDTLLAPLSSATVDLLTRKLNWRPDGSYELVNGAVGQAWDFGRGPPESLSELRQILATDPKMQLLVGHGCLTSSRLISDHRSCSTNCRHLPQHRASNSSSFQAVTCSIHEMARATRFVQRPKRL